VGVKIFLHQTTKRHTLTPNLVRQIVWRMWQRRCFDTIGYGARKKVRENRHWKIESSITLRRYCDVVIN